MSIHTLGENMKHFVKLSNGKTAVLIEEDNALSIALGDGDGDIDIYIAQITRDGVLAYSTAAWAPEDISTGLKNE
jgi:hypothetical protein